jgi:hypothetical protein
MEWNGMEWNGMDRMDRMVRIFRDILRPTARFFHEKNLKIFSPYTMRRCVHQLSHLFRIYDKHFYVIHTSIFVTNLLTS